MKKTNGMLFICMALVACHVFAIPPRRTDVGYKRAIVDGAETRFQLHVVDDDGQAVANAAIKVSFGMREEVRNSSFMTDVAGMATVHGMTTGGIRITIEKDGFYRSRLEFSYLRFAENRLVEGGRWQPWDEVRTARLRKIGRAEKLIFYNKTMSVPATNVWIGLDLELGDWIRPYGQGLNPDVEVRVIWDGNEPYLCKLCKTEMRFVGAMSGAYIISNVSESEMPFPREADTNRVYCSPFVYYDRKDGHICRATLLPTETKVARVRCKVSEKGDLLSAKYCNIRRLEASPGSHGTAVLGLAGVFNPNFNDNNLELLRK